METMAKILRDLRGYWTRGRTSERVAYVVAALLVASGLIHLIVYGLVGGPWLGPVSWRKAITFGLSFGITLAGVTWVASFITMGDRTRAWLLGLFTVASIDEVLFISMQVWRGVPSHLNMESPFNAVISQLLAAGGGVLTVVLVWLTILAFRRPIPAVMRLPIRAGLVILLVALATGAMMIATGSVANATEGQEAAYRVVGWLKPAHAVTMHAIEVLPGVAFLAAYTPWSPERRRRVTKAAVLGYAVLAAAVLAGNLIIGF